MYPKFNYTLDNKRYHTWNYHLKQKFGEKIFKVSLNAGFTCPNIDGTSGYGGCIYCSTEGSGDFAGNPKEPLALQFETIRQRMHEKWESGKYIAYFQAFTNTHAPVSILRAHFKEALSYPNVVGLSIATRPDCLPDDVVDLLEELSHQTYLIVELGLQTIHDKTGKLINRQHDFNTFLQGYQKLKDKHIQVCVHLINGLPFETPEMMLASVQAIAPLGFHSIKLHSLHILHNTPLANLYEKQKFHVLTLQEYVSVICDQIEYIPQETVLQRVTGDGKKEDLIAPLWSLKKFVVMNEIDKELKRRNSYQGIRLA